jgi:hypothetical protein
VGKYTVSRRKVKKPPERGNNVEMGMGNISCVECHP